MATKADPKREYILTYWDELVLIGSLEEVTNSLKDIAAGDGDTYGLESLKDSVAVFEISKELDFEIEADPVIVWHKNERKRLR